MTIRRNRLWCLLSLCLFLVVSFSTGTPRQAKVFGDKENLRVNPYLFNGFSKKGLYKKRTTPPYGYGILHNSSLGVDTIKIIALRVEFKADSSLFTTGNGMFGIYRDRIGNTEDIYESNYYKLNGGNGYLYDNLPHDSLYFADQLEFVKKYFLKVSNHKLFIEYEIFPKGKNEEHAYKVPDKMTKYSPGAKRDEESFDEYYYRRTVGLMEFVRDAIKAADSMQVDTAFGSPFRNLYRGENGFIFEKDPTNPAYKRKVAVLIFHAGASYLTDGGWDGNFGKDTPSDMIDAFISQEFFGYFADSISGIDTDSNNVSGIVVNRNFTEKLTLDELMMVSETSNQDSLNWGIHGILVNQVARQIGIPDLFSTMSGISGIGGFCIMDFAGYSSGRGFIPPWPSAWVRGFMGWDTPKLFEPGPASGSAKIKAVNTAQPGDTTMLLVPINNHEFYLIENRQRNLSSSLNRYNYDTSETDNRRYISSFNHVRLDSNIISTFTHPGDIYQRNVVDSVYNQDVSIPASGVCIWHIDEYIIRDHIEQNVVNADSLYRGISLEEADGIVDLGIMFQDVFYQATFDYGGAEDIFPHLSSKEGAVQINSMGPFTRPSTKSNDGGHTYLSLNVQPSGNTPLKRSGIDTAAIRDYYVYNYVDTSFTITVSRDNQNVATFPHWPKRIAASKFFEPVLCNVFANGDTMEVAIVDTAGRVYCYSAAGNPKLHTPEQALLPTIVYSGDTLYSDTVSFVATINNPAGMPTAIDSNLYIPSLDGNLYILRTIDSIAAIWDTTSLGTTPSSYVCNYDSTHWVVGGANGSLLFGDDATGLIKSLPVQAQSPIQALAVVDSDKGIIASITAKGLLAISSPQALLDTITLSTARNEFVYLPFTLVTADLDQDSIVDIVVCDRKQGLWLYNFDPKTNTIELDKEWVGWPNDWAGFHRLDTSRASIPDNASAPSIADLDNDNVLDIIVGGTNGVYAYNNRGVLLIDWPGLLDSRFWYQRGTITSSPVIAQNSDSSEPLVIFSAPTGENVTFAVANIYSSNPETGTIYYIRKDGIIDSIKGLTASFIDSLLVIGDSLVLPYITPGGYIDAFNTQGKRPDSVASLPNVGPDIQSNWPLTIGGSISLSPILCDLDNNNKTDIIALSNDGYLYRWEMANSIVSNSFIWPQAGANNSRTFSYAGPMGTITLGASAEIEYFYNFPNPVKDARVTNFKYRLSRRASKVRLDVFTYTGYHIISEPDLPTGFGWNERAVAIDKLGSAIYRCRLEADFNGTKKVKYWKMAVMK